MENPDYADEKTAFGLKQYRRGLMKALWDLYNEFDEVEYLPLDAKPRCFVCGEEVKPEDLAQHMKEHLENDELRGIRFPGLSRLESTPAFDPCSHWSEMGVPSVLPHRGPAIPLYGDEEFFVQFVEDPPPIQIIIHGVKYKKAEEDS